MRFTLKWPLLRPLDNKLTPTGIGDHSLSATVFFYSLGLPTGLYSRTVDVLDAQVPTVMTVGEQTEPHQDSGT